MKAFSIPVSLVLLLYFGGSALAQEAAEPSPLPAKTPVPKLRVPVLPTADAATAGVIGSAGVAPAAPGGADGSRVPPSPVPAARTAKPALPVVPRLPGAPPPPTSSQGPPRLSLEAISAINGKPIAVISGRKVAPGESIAGARVTRILEDRVELEYQGRRFAIGF